MPINISEPLLAVDVSLLIFVAIVAISLIKWLFQTIANQQAAPPARPRPQMDDRRRRERLQREIDQFSQEMSGRRRSKDSEIEILPEAQRRRRKSPQARQPSYELTEDDFLPSRSAPGTSIAQRHLQSNHLGENVQEHSVVLGDGVRQHLQQYMDERVEQSVQQHLGTSNEGRKAAAVVMPRAAAGSQVKLAALLRDPQTVRQAILLNEILSPPISQRNKRR